MLNSYLLDPRQPRPPSLWQAVTLDEPSFPALDRAHTTDVLVIGGGITGLSALLRLAERGVSACLIEAHAIGSGASGRSQGQIVPLLIQRTPEQLIAVYGREVGERFIALMNGAAPSLARSIAQHDLACEWHNNGWLYLAARAAHLARIERLADAWQAYGAAVAALDGPALVEQLGVGRAHGGLMAQSGGTLNPLALCRGLARRAKAHGAEVFCDTLAVDVSFTGAAWRISTTQGSILAGALLLAGNTATAHIFPQLRRSVLPQPLWLAASAPLGESERESLLPQGRAAMDSAHDALAWRVDPRGRLLLGGRLLSSINAPARLESRVRQRLAKDHPPLADIKLTHIWGGLRGRTADGVPHVHRLGPNAYAWLGDNGPGLALGWAIGRALAEIVTGQDQRELPLPLTTLAPLHWHGLRARLVPLGLAQARLRDRVERRRER